MATRKRSSARSASRRVALAIATLAALAGATQVLANSSGHDWPTDVPLRFRDGLVSHNDVNLDNVVFRDGEAVALIDFDLASPGSAVWDVALAARLWVPLRADAEVADQRRGQRARRLLLFADAYGLAERDRRRLVEAALETHHWCYAIVRAGAERGVPGYARYWSPVAQRRADRLQRWLADHRSELEQVLELGRPAAVRGPG